LVASSADPAQLAAPIELCVPDFRRVRVVELGYAPGQLGIADELPRVA